MTHLLKLLNLAPGWLYVTALAGLTVYTMWLDGCLSQAISDGVAARAALAMVKQDAATAATASTQAAREKEAVLNNTQTESTDELHKALAVSVGRAADLERRLRDIAHPGTGGACMPTSAQASGPGDGPPAAGLSDLARTDLVRLAQSANDTADTLKTCRVLLRQAWQVTN